MKRLYAVAVLVLFLAAICFVSIKTIRHNHDLLLTKLEECEKAYGQDDLQKKCSSLKENFTKSEKYLSIFVNRSLLDEIELCVARLPEYAAYNDESDFFSECATIRLTLMKMKNDESFTLLSFF